MGNACEAGWCEEEVFAEIAQQIWEPEIPEDPPLAGRWQSGRGNVHIIGLDSVQWRSGDVTPFTRRKRKGGKCWEYHAKLNGVDYVAHLDAEGQLQWSDGDVWTQDHGVPVTGTYTAVSGALVSAGESFQSALVATPGALSNASTLLLAAPLAIIDHGAPVTGTYTAVSGALVRAGESFQSALVTTPRALSSASTLLLAAPLASIASSMPGTGTGAVSSESGNFHPNNEEKATTLEEASSLAANTPRRPPQPPPVVGAGPALQQPPPQLPPLVLPLPPQAVAAVGTAQTPRRVGAGTPRRAGAGSPPPLGGYASPRKAQPGSPKFLTPRRQSLGQGQPPELPVTQVVGRSSPKQLSPLFAEAFALSQEGPRPKRRAR